MESPLAGSCGIITMGSAVAAGLVRASRCRDTTVLVLLCGRIGCLIVRNRENRPDFRLVSAIYSRERLFLLGLRGLSPLI